MEIHLIRHGKTFANENKLYCGQTDLPLSERGIIEITLLKKQGIYPHTDIFFSSGLIRTEQTIDIIYGDVDRKIISEIAEYNFGLFEMKSYEDLKEKADYQAWIADSIGNVKSPYGESKNQFEKRVIDGYKQIINYVSKKENHSAFVVCHGGTISYIMEYLFPNEKNFYEWQPKPARGYTVSYISKQHYIYKNI